MNIECVSDKALEDVSGGFSYDNTVVINDVKLSQKEFDELKNAKIIGDDGKLYYRDAEKAFDFLEKKGYERNVKTCADLGMCYMAIEECQREHWEKNEPVKFKII